MRTRLPAVLFTFLLAVALRSATVAQEPSTPPPSASEAAPHAAEAPLTLRTTVRRVVLDVVVTNSKGAPAPDLTKDDFLVTEDGTPQKVLSFDANGFSPEMDYVPQPLPPQPANTFINLPATPEKGPLYVLLYDLTNMDDPSQMNSPEDHSEQIIARQQMMKFIRDKPEGARFAIFVRSDGVHLIQGFTSDKALLYSALDPHNPKPHMPMVFLLGPNFGRGDRLSALDTLHTIARYLDGLPGRKNLIWFSSQFPLSLFASETDGISFQEETKATLDMLEQNQIAVYPVDARGVPAQDSHAQLTTSVHSDTITSPTEAGSGAGSTGGIGVGNSPSASSSFVQGSSAVNDSYNIMDGIARDTGGQAFYGSNDVAGELTTATESGARYYTLTYAPTNGAYDGKLRNIHVELRKKGYDLSYRRAYYATESPDLNVATKEPTVTETSKTDKAQAAQLPVVDRLSANMQHGAPTAHQLVFVVQAHTAGVPAEGTPQEMADLATEPAYFKTRRRSTAPKPLAPIPLQKDVFTFNIPVRQFKEESTLDLEVAVAAFDADGQMMNAVVRVAKKEIDPNSASGEGTQFYRIEQDLEVPLAATTIRFAVRDTTNDRTGAMEVKLPLAPAPEAIVATH